MIFFETHGVKDKEFFRMTSIKNYSFPLHFHLTFEIIYINEGHLSVSIDQKEYLLQKNDLAFIFPNQIHGFKTTDHSEITIILFSAELIGDFFINYKGMVPEDNILYLKNGFNGEKLRTIYSKKSFLYYICDKLIRHKRFNKVMQTPQTKLLHKMIHFVEENYSADCTLKDVAQKLRYDYQYLSKLFVKQMGMTFTSYLNNYRISQACYLLKNSNQSIKDIATNCGYNNLKTFHRNFRKITGTTPKEYKNME